MNKLATFFKFGTISLVVAAAVQCSSYSGKDVTQDAEGKIHEVKDALQDVSHEDTEGNTVATRFEVPKGYTRKTYANGTFGNYLQQFPLKPAGTLTKRYNGGTKPNNVSAAVVDI